tara:strand:+ start:4261 stop:5850 length:1590 start_codon:yes stop_codon:yes gene_type:complete
MFQQNGYKLNEMISWLTGHLFSKTILLEHIFYLVLILSMNFYIAEKITTSTGSLIMGIFAIFWFIDISAFRSEQEKKPLIFTPRMIRLSLMAIIPLLIIWYRVFESAFLPIPVLDLFTLVLFSNPYNLAFSLILVDIAIPVLLLLGGLAALPLETWIQNGFKRKARKKLASMPHLKVIAITGSYGKTSTKFAISAFLKERLNVCVTPGSYNTPMGICKVINNDLNARHEVLILEMGARYEGNIKELCDIAKPDISVITNVGISHLETFGSVDTIAKEKSTLATELKTDGTLILNGDDPKVRKMGNLRNDVNTVFTGNGEAVEASDIKIGSEGTSFNLKFNNRSKSGREDEEVEIKTRLLGSHNIQNLLLAAAVANELDIRPATIAIAASAMKPVEHRLELKQQNGFLIIDDAFNSNPVGAKSAVDVLSTFEGGKKIIITPGMIELGDSEEIENERFGRHIGESSIDLAILVGSQRTIPILRGIESTDIDKKTQIKVVDSLFDANRFLKEFAEPGDIVLYENDLPDSYQE